MLTTRLTRTRRWCNRATGPKNPVADYFSFSHIQRSIKSNVYLFTYSYFTLRSVASGPRLALGPIVSFIQCRLIGLRIDVVVLSQERLYR